MDTALAPDNSPANLSRLSRGFAVLAALTFCLIVVGALVRANGAGLACPDWPLCFGEVIPQFDLKVAFEWGHRVFASFVSLGLLVLSVMSWHLPRCAGGSERSGCCSQYRSSSAASRFCSPWRRGR